MEMAMESGKNAEIAAKMVDGKINALVADLALLEQPFVKDPARKIKDVIGANGTVSAFLRWQVGETG
jgi:elongation factor Ts